LQLEEQKAALQEQQQKEQRRLHVQFEQELARQRLDLQDRMESLADSFEREKTALEQVRKTALRHP
jgi:hypothetical protein